MTAQLTVYCVSYTRIGTAPLALGLIQAHAQHGPHPVEARFIPLMNLAPAQIGYLARAFGPGVWLCSDFLWSIEQTLEVSRLAKELDPRNVTVHGGPSAPAYPGACEDFMAAHPEVDIVCRGEGEATALALLHHFAARARGEPPAEELAEIAGISFRGPGGELRRTADRPRIACLDDIPSPYLSGIFDHYRSGRGGFTWATLETNRGCPYQCTFCDWGALTQQKIAVFDLARVKAEIDWIGRQHIGIVHIADANVGILPRDLEIAQAFADTRARYGYPREITCSLTKNGSPRLLEMCRLWQEAGIKFTAIFSIQTTAPEALTAVKRKNIKTDHFQQQIAAIHAQGIDYGVELMMGLPGQTLASFRADLQRYSDHRAMITAYRTRLLPNSPMAAPDYRVRHGIEVDAEELIRATHSCNAEDMSRMNDLFRIFDVAVNHSCLRYVLLYCQWEYGVPQVELLFRFLLRLQSTPEAFSPQTRQITGPQLDFLQGILQTPGAALTDILAFLREELAIGDDPAFDVVATANDAVLPRSRKPYPQQLPLRHDLLQYFADRCRGSTKPLRDYGPGALHINDPDDWAGRDPQKPFPEIILRQLGWELHSPLPEAAGWPRHEKQATPA